MSAKPDLTFTEKAQLLRNNPNQTGSRGRRYLGYAWAIPAAVLMLALVLGVLALIVWLIVASAGIILKFLGVAVILVTVAVIYAQIKGRD